MEDNIKETSKEQPEKTANHAENPLGYYEERP